MRPKPQSTRADKAYHAFQFPPKADVAYFHARQLLEGIFLSLSPQGFIWLRFIK
jgi:hypothetical protein